MFSAAASLTKFISFFMISISFVRRPFTGYDTEPAEMFHARPDLAGQLAKIFERERAFTGSRFIGRYEMEKTRLIYGLSG